MSYSYIKSVFPNFEDSTKVYNDNLYNNISNQQESSLAPPIPTNLYNDLKEVPAQIEPPKANEDENIVLTQTKLLESYQNSAANFVLAPKKNNTDNLHFYNLPVPKEYIQNSKLEKTVEKFENQKQVNTCELDCDSYIKHINECNKCKGIVLKQFGIETDRIKNEEIMEVISYLIFGLFVLLLIDSLKTSK
jgi:hypothetical protein